MKYILIRFKYIISTLKLKLRKNIFISGWCDYLNVSVIVERNGKLEIGEMSSARSGTKIYVRNGAYLKIGKGVTFNHNCIIVVRNRVTIGDGTIFGPGVFIYDHDHNYRSKLEKINSSYVIGTVDIGRNCWIAANTGILKNTVIGDGCVVAAGTIVDGSYGNDLLIYNSRKINCKPVEKDTEDY